MINWKNEQKNAYPNIILSDSVIDNLKVDNRNIILNLERRGFAIKCNNGLYYAKSAQVIIEDCDIDNIQIQCIFKRKKLSGKMINIVMNMEAKELFNNISSKKWRYEIVEEYYSEMGVFLIGRIRERKQSMWCYIKAQYKNMSYFWSEIDYGSMVN